MSGSVEVDKEFAPTPEIIEQTSNVYLEAFDYPRYRIFYSAMGYLQNVYRDVLVRQYKDRFGAGLGKNQVCPEWCQYKDTFYEWGLSTGCNPADDVILIRKNEDGPFSPDNCYWVKTPRSPLDGRRYIATEQIITYRDVSLSVQDWSKLLGIKQRSLLPILLRRTGYDLRKALSRNYGNRSKLDLTSFDEAVDNYYRKLELRAYKKAQYWLQLQSYGNNTSIEEEEKALGIVEDDYLEIEERIQRMVDEFDDYN